MNRSRCAVVILAVLATLAACSSGSTHPHKAAEPASAPPIRVTPAGVVRSVGSSPEGIVYDARFGLVAVAVHDPYRLLLLDPSTLAVRHTVPLPGKVRHLQTNAAGTEILVPVESVNRLVQVALPSYRTTVTTVLSHPHDAAATANGDVAVGDEFGMALSIVRDGRVVHTFHDLQQPGGVVADGNLVTVVDVRAYTLTTYNLNSMRETRRRSVGAGPTHGVLATGHRVVVADTRGNRLYVYSDRTLDRLGELSLPGTPYGITVDRRTDTVWVTLTARNQVVGVDVAGDRPQVVARLPTVRQPNTVAVEPGSGALWVTGTDAGVVERIPHPLASG